ncbi:MAG TPA: choice-of-anchor Q domain-containing protein, partial [Rhodanobacteraceae bacterium]|nr:choice-of-anchor Q domain-containing protein [Rhodanobacteraceae bacterium]
MHLVACLALGTMASAHAETLQVSNSNDAGAGSLRAAITAANASASDSTITFAPGTDGVAIVLASALPDLSDVGGALTIVGNGPAATLVDGAGLYRPLHFDGSNLDLSVSQLTFRNGFADQGQGGAIYFRGDAANAHLNLDTVEFDSNQATYGGGAVFVTATVTVDRCTFAYNASDNPGAALHGNAGQLDITNSVFVGNDGSGATILHFSSNAQARLVNLTLTQNAAHSGTVFVDQGASFSISNSLVVNNSNYDLATAPDGTVDLAQSFNNVFSKLEPDVLFAEGVNGNRLGVTAAYASALGNYGGPIRTVALLPGSPAIDAGSASVAGLPASDQRGQPRLGAPDVGAFESQGYVLAVAAGGTQSAEVDRHFAAPLRVAVNPNNALDPVEGGVVQFSAPGSGASAVLATPSASIGADGTAQTLAYANAQPGGPYNVAVNTSIATAAAFQLTNTSGECLGYAFPYTLAANDNAARVAELRQAIDCSNDNGLDDVIDLAGYTLNFDDAAWTDASTGASALPEVISDKRLGLRNGRLQRADNAPAFRFLQSDPAAALEIEQLQFVNGRTPHAGGAILAGGSLVVRDSRFESNHATTAGGAVSVGTTNRSVYFIGSTFAHNTSPAGAALALASAQALMSRSTLLANGDADTLSVVWSVGSLYLADSLL